MVLGATGGVVKVRGGRFVKGDEGRGVERIGDRGTTRIRQGREPGITVGVEVAHNNRVVVVEETKDRSDVEIVAGRTGRVRRDVAVDDVDRSAAEGDVDALDFECSVVVGDWRQVEKSERNGVMNKRDEAAAVVVRSVEADDSVVAESRVANRRRKLGFLKAGDENLVLPEVVAKFV